MAKKKEEVAALNGMQHEEVIEVIGAREHNLKNIDITIPKNKLVVFTGVSGSGKSSLAFDTIFNEGQRRYMESFSAYARQFIGDMERPDVDKITGLSPVISIEQKTTNKNPRSSVGDHARSYARLIWKAFHRKSFEGWTRPATGYVSAETDGKRTIRARRTSIPSNHATILANGSRREIIGSRPISTNGCTMIHSKVSPLPDVAGDLSLFA